MKRGDVVAVAPGSAASIRTFDKDVVKAIAVPWSAILDFAGEAGQHLPRNGNLRAVHAGFIEDLELQQLLSNLWSRSAVPQQSSRLALDGLLLQLLARMSQLSGVERQRLEAARKGGLSPQHLNLITDYLQVKLADQVSLARLSELTGLSVFHVCRAFRESTGLPPHRWQTERRLERACQLLSATEQPVAEIAAAVGYDDPGGLSNAFKRRFNVSPREYRRLNRF